MWPEYARSCLWLFIYVVYLSRLSPTRNVTGISVFWAADGTSCWFVKPRSIHQPGGKRGRWLARRMFPNINEPPTSPEWKTAHAHITYLRTWPIFFAISEIYDHNKVGLYDTRLFLRFRLFRTKTAPSFWYYYRKRPSRLTRLIWETTRLKRRVDGWLAKTLMSSSGTQWHAKARGRALFQNGRVRTRGHACIVFPWSLDVCICGSGAWDAFV